MGSRPSRGPSIPIGSTEPMRAAAAARPIALGPSIGRSTVVLGGGLVLLTAIALVSVAVGTSGVGSRGCGRDRPASALRPRLADLAGRVRDDRVGAAPPARRGRDARGGRPRLRGDGLPGAPAQPDGRSLRDRHGGRGLARRRGRTPRARAPSHPRRGLARPRSCSALRVRGRRTGGGRRLRRGAGAGRHAGRDAAARGLRSLVPALGRSRAAHVRVRRPARAPSSAGSSDR